MSLASLAVKKSLIVLFHVHESLALGDLIVWTRQAYLNERTEHIGDRGALPHYREWGELPLFQGSIGVAKLNRPKTSKLMGDCVINKVVSHVHVAPFPEPSAYIVSRCFFTWWHLYIRGLATFTDFPPLACVQDIRKVHMLATFASIGDTEQIIPTRRYIFRIMTRFL